MEQFETMRGRYIIKEAVATFVSKKKEKKRFLRNIENEKLKQLL